MAVRVTHQQNGFTPTLAQRRLLSRAQVAYLHDDGIAGYIEIRKSIKVGKGLDPVDIRFEQWFVWPCPLRLNVGGTRNGEQTWPTIGRVVLHTPSVLLDGVRGYRVYLGDGSENSRALGLTVNSHMLSTPAGAHHYAYQIRQGDRTIIGPDYTPQFVGDAWVETKRLLADWGYPEDGTVTRR